MKFSILISTYNRENTIKRCLDSIFLQQQYDDFEVVLINDCSPDNTEDVLKSLPYWKDPRLVYVKNEIRSERVRSYNKALGLATGDWVFHMGSDDLVFPRLLEFLAIHISNNPGFKLFNYGWAAINHHNLRMSTTPGKEFIPLPEGGHEHFDSGLVAAGSFCWYRGISYLIEFPDAGSCYEFADKAGIPGYDRFTRTLGNPWGEDYYIFWKLTRKHTSKWIPLFGVIVNIR